MSKSEMRRKKIMSEQKPRQYWAYEDGERVYITKEKMTDDSFLLREVRSSDTLEGQVTLDRELVEWAIAIMKRHTIHSGYMSIDYCSECQAVKKLEQAILNGRGK